MLQMQYFTGSRAFPLPTPPPMNNHGNYIISLSQFARWLGEQVRSSCVLHESRVDCGACRLKKQALTYSRGSR